MKPKHKCEQCGNLHNKKGLSYFKGKLTCSNCKNARKIAKDFQSVQSIGKTKISLQQAIDKTYNVHYSIRKRGDGKKGKESIACYTIFPSALIGKKFKVKLVEDEE